MEISVRSYLTAGTVAVVGAGAIAFAPALPAAPALSAVPAPPVAAQVSLAAASLSLSDIVGGLQSVLPGPSDLLALLPSVLPTLPSIPQEILNLLPANFLDAVATEFFNQAGAQAQTAGAAIIGALGDAVNGLVSGPNSIPTRFTAALVNFPNVLSSAWGAVLVGDFATAVQIVGIGLMAPIDAVVQAISDAAKGFGDFVAATANGLLNSLPSILVNALGTVAGGNLQAALDTISSGLQAALDSIKNTVSGLLGGVVPGVSAPAAAAALAAPRAAASVTASAAPSGQDATAPISRPQAPALRAAASEAPVADVPADTPAAVEVSPEATVSEVTPVPVSPRPRAALPRPDRADAVAADAVVTEVTAAPKPSPRPRPTAGGPVKQRGIAASVGAGSVE